MISSDRAGALSAMGRTVRRQWTFEALLINACGLVHSLATARKHAWHCRLLQRLFATRAAERGCSKLSSCEPCEQLRMTLWIYSGCSENSTRYGTTRLAATENIVDGYIGRLAHKCLPQIFYITLRTDSHSSRRYGFYNRGDCALVFDQQCSLLGTCSNTTTG